MADVRFNELPGLGDEVLKADDIVAVLHTDTNVLRGIRLADIRIFALSGGEATPMPPVVNGGSLIIKITEAEEGTNRVDIPELSGKNFILRRRGGGAMIPGEEYDALSSGGFILLKEGDILVDEEIFEADVYSLQGGTPSVNQSSGSSFITGVFPVTTNQLLTENHKNKLIQVRGGTDSLTITLPSVEAFPENTIIPIEALISNSKPSKIITQGGQVIYYQNISSDHLWIGAGEFVWLMRTEDGWYPINYHGNFFSVGQIHYGFKAGLNQFKLDGSVLLRASYPRLWEWVQTLGSSLVSDATWNTASVNMSNPTRSVPFPYRGCFSTGNGSSTFRLPDFRGSGLRMLAASESDRYANIAGVFQDDMFKAHNHTVIARAIDEQGQGYLTGGGNNNGNPNNNDGTFTTTDGGGGGSESRMANIGLHAFINF